MKLSSKFHHFLGASLGLIMCSALQAAPSITIDLGITHQEMTGWEVTGRMWQFDKAADRFNGEWELHAETIFDKLVEDLGINRFRLEALSGMENPIDYWEQFESGAIGYTAMRDHFYEKINDNADPQITDLDNIQFSYMDYIVENMLLPIKQRVEANGEKLYINLNYVDFKWTDLRGNIEHALDPDEYAEFIVACFTHLRDKYGLIPDALEVILEADNTTYWTGINIGHGLLAAKARLNAAGFYPEFIAPSTALAARALTYFNQLVSVPGAGDALTTFAYHRYDSTVSTGRLTDIASAARRWNLRTGMLEHVGGDVDELLDDLIFGNVSSWQQYGIATNLEDNPGGYYLKANLDNPASPVIYLDKRAAVLSLLFKYVRMGAMRLDAESDDSSITPVAFVNPDQSHVLTLRSTRKQSVRINGMPQGTYHVVHASENGVITGQPGAVDATFDSFDLELTAGLTTLHSAPVLAESEPANSPDLNAATKGEPGSSADTTTSSGDEDESGIATTVTPVASVSNSSSSEGTSTAMVSTSETPSASQPTNSESSAGGVGTLVLATLIFLLGNRFAILSLLRREIQRLCARLARRQHQSSHQVADSGRPQLP